MSLDKKKLTQLEKARKQKVAKRNDMMRSYRQSLSLVENKVVTYVFSKVKPGDSPDTIYRFDCQEFFQIMRYKKQSYSDLRAMLYYIASQTFGIIDEKTGTEKIVHWFNTIHLKKNNDQQIVSDSTLPSRYIEIRIHEDLREYIFDLEKQRVEQNIFYSTYQLQNVSLFKHVYSQHLYELLKTYENRREWTFEYGTGTENDIQMKLAVYAQVPEDDGNDETEKKTTGRIKRQRRNVPKYEAVIPETWSKFYFFDRKVLRPSREEINRYTDIEFDYYPSKYDIGGTKRRKYSTITFIIRKKTKEQQKATEEIIDHEYEAFDDQYAYRQLNIDEFIDAPENPSPSPAVIEEDDSIKMQMRKEEIISKAKFKIAASVFYDDFKQKEIQHLMDAALKHFPITRIKREDREMWSIDFISYYYDKIKATDDETKTSTYRRLLDAVTKDYDRIADEPTVYDIDDTEFYGGAQAYTDKNIIDSYGYEVDDTSKDGESSSAMDKNIDEMSIAELDNEIAKLREKLKQAELRRMGRKNG